MATVQLVVRKIRIIWNVILLIVLSSWNRTNHNHRVYSQKLFWGTTLASNFNCMPTTLRCGKTKCDCKIDWLWVWSPLEEMKYFHFNLNLYFQFFALVSRQSAALSSATQHAMPTEFSRKWRTECLNTVYLFISN